MKEQILKILDECKKYGYSNEAVAGELLGLFSVSKRHLIESILDDVKQSHLEYAVEKIESYLDDGC